MSLRNAELQRNLWLEMTPQRLVAAPVLVGLVTLAIVSGWAEPLRTLRFAGMTGFVVLTALWGARLAGQSLSEEFADGTWDGQRISGLSAWEMVAGKLFGGASFAWYAGACCLLVFAAGAIGTQSLPDLLRTLAGLLALAIFTQSLSLLSVLIGWRRLRFASISRRRSRGIGLLMVFFIAPSLVRGLPWLDTSGGNTRFVIWFDQPWMAGDFALVSILLFAGWALLGAHRAMRTELQFRNRPWYWIAFVLFVQIYAAGWIGVTTGIGGVTLASLGDAFSHIAVPRLMLAASIALTFAYSFIFVEPKNRLLFLRMIADWQSGRRRAVFDALPLWIVNAAITIATSLVMLIYAMTTGTVREVIALSAGTVAVLLYGVRDFAIVLWCNLGNSQRRADGAALVYLLALYVLLPGLFWAIGLPVLIGFAEPYSTFTNPFWLLFAAIWAAAGLELLRRRWGREDASA